MSVEFIGFIGNHNASETIARQGPVIDRDFIRASAAIHEAAGFDRVLLAFHSSTPDSLFVGQYVASVTRRLKLMLAHRPGFTAPTLAARQLATLDHLTDGRIAVHIITGGNDRELEQDGDWLTKDERYARTREYLDIVRQEWSSETPFDYHGDYYRVKGALSDIKRRAPRAFRSISAAPPPPRSTWRASMPMSMRCGAKPTTRWPRPSPRFAPLRPAMAANPGFRCRCGPSLPRPRMRHGPRPPASWNRPRPCARLAASRGWSTS